MSYTDVTLLSALLGACTYRTGRLVLLDTITAKPRHALLRFLGRRGKIGLWLSELIGCPYCITVWISGVIVVAVDGGTDASVPLPFAVWGGAAAFSLVIWAILDPEDEDEDEEPLSELIE